MKGIEKNTLVRLLILLALLIIAFYIITYIAGGGKVLETEQYFARLCPLWISKQCSTDDTVVTDLKVETAQGSKTLEELCAESLGKVTTLGKIDLEAEDWEICQKKCIGCPQ